MKKSLLKFEFRISIFNSSLFALASIWLCALSSSVYSKPDKIVCYFSNWAIQRPGLGGMIPEHIDPCLCTHLIYAFSEMKDNKLHPMEKYDQADGDNDGFFIRMNNLKQKNPKLKTLLAVGGWDMGMAAFTAMVKDDKNIKKFVQSTIEYLKKYNFDGLDLDFEYPGIDWRGSPAEDKMAFTKLCRMLREAFEEDAKKTGKDRFLLTAAVAGARNTIDKAYEVDKVCEYVDWLNLMTYDLHGPWDTNAGHHSAIHGKDKQDYLYIDFIIKYYESKGAPRNKLVLGLANYGRSDSPAMPYTGFKGESGFVAYYETCVMLACEGWKEFWNEAQLVPYAKGKENFPWAGYDNVKSMKIKAEYIVKEKLAGAMFWTVDLDDFTGKMCCQGHFPLIRTVKSILENDPSMMPPAKICSSCPNKEYKNLKKKYNKRKRRSADEVCTEKGEGVWPDPTDCTKYFVCRSMTTAWAEKKQEVCYTGSYFEAKAGQCKWVGQGNYNCDEILGKEGDATDKDETKTSDSKDETTTTTGKKDDKKKKTQVPDAESMKDTIIPPEQYTCRAEPEIPYEQNPDYIKCFSCESDSKQSAVKCKQTPRNDSGSTVWCNVKQQMCYSKALYKGAELVSFQRGCAALGDLGDAAATNKEGGESGGGDSGGSGGKVTCVKKNNQSQSCYETCDRSLCNTNSELKASSAVSPSVKSAAINKPQQKQKQLLTSSNNNNNNNNNYNDLLNTNISCRRPSKKLKKLLGMKKTKSGKLLPNVVGSRHAKKKLLKSSAKKFLLRKSTSTANPSSFSSLLVY